MSSVTAEKPPADEDTSEREESFMDCWEPFISYSKTSKLVKPGNAAFDYPTEDAEATAVRLATFGQLGPDTSSPQGPPVRLAVISAVPEDGVRLGLRSAWFTADGSNGIHQCR